MIQKAISIMLLITMLTTMLTTTIGLELFQIAQVLLKGESIEYVLESEEDSTEKNETKEKEAKEIFEATLLRQLNTPRLFVSNIEKSKLSTDELLQSHQNHLSIQDLPPEV
jgi:hypothetical protein